MIAVMACKQCIYCHHRSLRLGGRPALWPWLWYVRQIAWHQGITRTSAAKCQRTYINIYTHAYVHGNVKCECDEPMGFTRSTICPVDCANSETICTYVHKCRGTSKRSARATGLCIVYLYNHNNSNTNDERMSFVQMCCMINGTPFILALIR